MRWSPTHRDEEGERRGDDGGPIGVDDPGQHEREEGHREERVAQVAVGHHERDRGVHERVGEQADRRPPTIVAASPSGHERRSDQPMTPSTAR